MLDFIFAILLIAAIILLIIASQADSELWADMFLTIDVFFWYFLAASGFEIEVPYSLYNSSSSTIESGLNIVSSKISPEMMYFCMGIGSICLVVSIYMTGSMIADALHPKPAKATVEKPAGDVNIIEVQESE